MTDEEQKKLGLTNTQRIIYEYYEDHPEELAKLAEALQPVTDAITDLAVKLSEALTPIIDALIPIIEEIPVEELIDAEEDEEDSKDD